MRIASYNLSNTQKTKLLDVADGTDWLTAETIYAQNKGSDEVDLIITHTIQGDEVEVTSTSLVANQSEPIVVHASSITVEPTSFISATASHANVNIEFVVMDHAL